MVKVLVATAFATLIPAFVVVGRSIISDSSLKPWDPNNDSGNHIIQPAGEGDDGWTLFEGGKTIREVKAAKCLNLSFPG